MDEDDKFATLLKSFMQIAVFIEAFCGLKLKLWLAPPPPTTLGG